MTDNHISGLESTSNIPNVRGGGTPLYDNPSPILSSGPSSSSCFREDRQSSQPFTIDFSPSKVHHQEKPSSLVATASSKPTGSSSRPPRRRIRPKIALDHHQPLTAQGKPRARVYVACNQCRVRKTRCDGAKPICYNCLKRPPEVGECDYEGQPKRRGQDKAPGTRVRTSVQRAPKRKRVMQGDDNDSCHGRSDSSSHVGDETSSSLHLQAPHEEASEASSDVSEDEYDPFPLVDLDSPDVNLDCYMNCREEGPSIPTIPVRPSLQFTRETWWDALLTFYSTEDGTTDAEAVSLSSEQRTSMVQHIVSDLRALFHSSIYWVSFIHLPRFFDTLLHPTRRRSMQPSLVLSALAMGTFAQSSEAEQGAQGRAKALRLLDLAHGALQASLASGWVDIGLIQAAWLMVYLEMSHPDQPPESSRSSMLLLDSLIRLFSLTTLDADIKRAHATQQPAGTFSFTSYSNPLGSLMQSSQSVPSHTEASIPSFFNILGQQAAFPGLNGAFIPPIVQGVHSAGSIIPDNITLGPSTTNTGECCTCATLCLEYNWPSVRGIAPGWAGTLIWPEGVSEGEFRKEECRRLVWASVMVTASVNAYTSVFEDIERNRLWIKNPDNYTLLFPGEALALAGVPVPANNVWTLYLRSMLLLHSCVRSRGDLTLSDAGRAQFAMRAWLEIDTIEDTLNRHTCALERNFGFQAREMLFSSRMCVSHEFQRYIPLISTNGSRLFYRDKAEAWLRHRMMAVERVWQDLREGVHSPALDYRKPLLIYWFMSHIIKALVLWKADPTLTVALEASKTFSKRAEYFMMFWPSVEQRREWQKVRYQLVEACLQAGISPPETTLPSPAPRVRKQTV